MAKIYRNGRGSLVTVITALVIVLLFLGLVSLIAWQRQAVPTFDGERRQTRLKNLADLNADNDKVLSHYRWIDRQKGIVGIPIERAKQLIIAELETNKPHPAGLINPPVPAPAANGSPVPTANPAASPSPAAGVPPAAPAPGAAASPVPVANPQSAPAPPVSNVSPAATPLSK